METTKRSLLLDWNDVVYEGRNELVFEFKNREYGAYQIRREYHGNMILSLGGAFLFVLLCFGTPIIYTLLKQTAEISFVPEEQGIMELTTDCYVPPVPPSHTPPPQPKVNLADLVPEVVKDDKLNPGEKLETEKPEDSGKDISTGTGKDATGTTPSIGTGTETGIIPTDNKEEAPYIGVPEMPEFAGGIDAMYGYLRETLIYPQVPKEIGKSGVVHVSFVVSKTGEITEVRILKGVDGFPEFDREAMRVVKKMPAWKPGKMNGREVSVIMSLPIRFVLK